MASSMRRPSDYRTYGNVAYQHQYDGSAVRSPRRQGMVAPLPNETPRIQPRERVHRRPRVAVRQAGFVAPFTVVGFFAVALCAAFLVISYAQLTIINDQRVHLQEKLDDLLLTQATLLVQYELAYDLTAIEQQLTSDGSMVKLQPDQIVYLDISEPDSLIIYPESHSGSDLLWESILSLFSDEQS